MDEDDDIMRVMNLGDGDNNDDQDGGLEENVVYLRNFFDAPLPLPLPVIRTDELPGTSIDPLQLFRSGERQSPLLESQDPGNQLMNMWNDLTKERAERQFVETQRHALEAEVQKLRLENEEIKQQKEDLERQLQASAHTLAQQAAKPKRVFRTKKVIMAENEELKENVKALRTKLSNVEDELLKTKDAKMELHERLHTVDQELQTMQKERTTELQSRINQQNIVIEDLRFQLDPFSQHLPPLSPGHEAVLPPKHEAV